MDAEPNVQKKYHGLNPNFNNAIAINVLRLAIDFKRKKTATKLFYYQYILFYTINYLNSFELENKIVFRYRI